MKRIPALLLVIGTALAGALAVASCSSKPAASSSGSAASSPAPAAELEKRVDALFTEWDKPDSPGCALGVIRDGKFVYRHGYGMADLEYGIPITSESVFRIGSTSKQFTAMCLALLEEEDKLSLDDSLRQFLPEMPGYADEITLRHLIHHTSGIRDYLTLWEIAGDREDDYLVDGEVVDLLARQRELNFAPGDEHLYSNSGYFLLSQVVLRATGQTLAAYAAEHIFKPLGMTATHFHDDHTAIVKNRAAGYAPTDGGGFRISMTTLDMCGDGGVFTTVDDLLLWDGSFYNNRLGKGGQALIDKVLTPGVLNSGKRLDYSFGLGLGTYKGLKTVSHGGAFVGYRADIIRTFVAEGLPFRVEVEFEGGEAGKPAILLVRQEGAPGLTFERVTLQSPSESEFQAYCGRYSSDEVGATYVISLENGALRLKNANRYKEHPKDPLEPTFPDRFQVEGLKLNFRRAPSGAVTGFTVDAGRVKNILFRLGSDQAGRGHDNLSY